VKEVVFCSGALRAALVPQFGPRRFRAYLAAGGDPAALDNPDARPLGADLSARLKITAREAAALARRLRAVDVEAVREAAGELNAQAVAWGDENYPARLERLADPPPALFVRGALPGPEDRTAAIVGSRKATSYGLRLARTLAADLVRAGFCVVSGLARGIDAAAHEAALAAGGRTVGVMGSGLLQPYPPEHTGLMDRVAESGAVVSEFPLDAPPSRASFPRRNRVVAALSEAVLVVEAGRKSGALTTARHAADLGVEVLAAPGPVDREQSLGTLGLLRDGATPLGSVQDVFAALGFCDPACLDLPEAELAVLEAMSPEAGAFKSASRQRSKGGTVATGSSPEEIAAALGWNEEVAAGYLVTLEVRGLIERETGGRYVVR
jgi:DNA processing protein